MKTDEEYVEEFIKEFGGHWTPETFPNEIGVINWLRTTLGEVRKEAFRKGQEDGAINRGERRRIIEQIRAEEREKAVREERERIIEITKSRLPAQMTPEEMNIYCCEGSVLYWGMKLIEALTPTKTDKTTE